MPRLVSVNPSAAPRATAPSRAARRRHRHEYPRPDLRPSRAGPPVKEDVPCLGLPIACSPPCWPPRPRSAPRAAGADAEPLNSDDAAVQRVYDGVSRVIEDWRNSHPAACGEKGCRDPQMITSKNIGACFAWMCDLRDHLLHTDHDRYNGVFGVEGDTSMFKKGCLKSFAMLPYASPRAKSIAISPTILFGLLRDAGMLAKGTEFEDTKVKDVTSNPDPYFRAAFRNLDKAIRNGHEFDNFIKTDGYSVSVAMSREKRVEVDQQQMAYRPGRGYVKVERTDMHCITPPSVPQPGQRGLRGGALRQPLPVAHLPGHRRLFRRPHGRRPVAAATDAGRRLSGAAIRPRTGRSAAPRPGRRHSGRNRSPLRPAAAPRRSGSGR